MAYKEASSSSSSLTRPGIHDVFLSFRGTDTRSGFTYNLYKALDREKIKTFFDDRTLKRGENISAALLRAIEVSKISVVICSENYASSSWCLDELVKILECQKSKQQIVIPVFYKVDPAHVRHQTGSFGQALAGLKYNKDKVPRWRAALTQVANLSGWTYVDGYESDFIEKIVKDVVGLNDQKMTKEDESNKRDSTGLEDQKKNKDGADLYNQAVLEVQNILNGADLYNQSLLDVQKNINGADLYNQALLQVQKNINGEDLYNQALLEAQKIHDGVGK
ncbi:disease resistance protein RUN1-like [Rosa sericea]